MVPWDPSNTIGSCGVILRSVRDHCNLFREIDTGTGRKDREEYERHREACRDM